MFNLILYKREMKSSLKMLLIFGAVITLYVSMIISMYDPEMMKTLDSFYEVMPELMASVGMSTGAANLIEFMISYLYGFILLVFPMVFCILRANGLVARYMDSGAMQILLQAPVKRRAIVLTQMLVLISGVFVLLLYTTLLEIVVAQLLFEDALVIEELLRLNLGLLALQLCIGSLCFLSSCFFSDSRYSIAFGAGIPGLMFVLQMLANAGQNAEFLKYFTLFTLFDASGIVEGTANAIVGGCVFLVLALAFYSLSVVVFCKKDLYI